MNAVKKIAFEKIGRFHRVRDHIKDIDFATIAFDGFDKFTKQSFRYERRHVDPPDCIWFRSSGPDWSVLNAPLSVSFGGTVSASADGIQMAILLAQATIRNKGIVMGGGVLGVDMVAHMGALDAEGTTIAVVANPVKFGIHPYRPRRSFLESAILRAGGIVSQYDCPYKDAADFRDRLLQRDRIITALCDVFVAIECGKNSATVDAAKRAHLQGRRVVAIDWTQLSPRWREPDPSGFEQLRSEIAAESFPFEAVHASRDSFWWDLGDSIADQFRHILRELIAKRGRTRRSTRPRPRSRSSKTASSRSGRGG